MATADRVQEVYIAYYGRPADSEGLAFWISQLEAAGGDLTAIIEQFGTSDEFNERFGDDDNETLINNIYQNLFGRDADEEGLAFYLNLLETGEASLADISLRILDGAQNDDARDVAAKVAAGNLFTDAAGPAYEGSDAADAAAAWMATINRDTDLEELASNISDIVGGIVRGNVFTLTEALAAEELPDVYEIDPAVVFDAGTVDVEVAEAAYTSVVAILEGAENAEELVLTDLFVWALADTLENLVAADAEVVEGAASWSLTETEFTAETVTATVAGLEDAKQEARDEFFTEAEQAIVDGASNSDDVNIAVPYILADTLENLVAADAEVVEGAASWSLTNEDTNLGNLTQEAFDIASGASNSVEFTFGLIGEAFTLTESVRQIEEVTEDVEPVTTTEIYWGFNPWAPGTEGVDNTAGGNESNLANEGPLAGGVPLSVLEDLLEDFFGYRMDEQQLLELEPMLQAVKEITEAGIEDMLQGAGAIIDSEDQGALAGLGGIVFGDPDEFDIELSDGPTITVGDDGQVTILPNKQGDYTGDYQVVLNIDSADTAGAQVALSQQQFDFMNGLLFDAEGNSRLFEKEVTELPMQTVYVDADGMVQEQDDLPNGIAPDNLPAGWTSFQQPLREVITEEGRAVFQPIVLTPTQNNGGTVEQGYTTGGSDTIVVGRLDLLHQAYIDAGGGYDTLEVDAKGHFAQPLQLLNIQHISVQNLPNIYDYDGVMPGDLGEDFNFGRSEMGGEDGFLDPENNVDGDGNLQNDQVSILDLSRAVDIEKLTVTEGGFTNNDRAQNDGALILSGIRNAAELNLEGGFSQDLVLNYGRGNTANGLDIVLHNVDFHDDAEFKIAHNANTLNITALGGDNHLNNIDSLNDATLSTINVSGDAHLHISEDLSGIYMDGDGHHRLATFNAEANTGGVNIYFDGQERIDFTGSQADDVLKIEDAHEVTVNNAAGANRYDIEVGGPDDNGWFDGGEINITDGTGSNRYFLETCGCRDAVVNVSAQGEGNNHLILDDTTDNTDDTTDNTTVAIHFEGDDNIVDLRDEVDTADITLGGENGMVFVDEATTVNVTAEGGRNTIDLYGENLSVEAGGSHNNLLLNGTYDRDDLSSDGDTEIGNGALINVAFTGEGTNSVTLGHPAEDGRDTGVTALEGSSISGSDVRLTVLEDSDLRAAELEGISSVVMNAELTLTVEQFLEIGAEAFEAYRQTFGAEQTLNLIVNSDTDLSDVDLSSLREFNFNVDGEVAKASGIELNFLISKGAELTLTAEQLHYHVDQIESEKGAVGEGLLGSVKIVGAGPTFDPYHDFDFEYEFGGSLSSDFDDSGNVTIIRDGVFERPGVSATTDVITLNSDEIDGPIDGDFTTLAQKVEIVGESDLVFEDGAVVNMTTKAKDGFTLDFSALGGNLTGLTLAGIGRTDAADPATDAADPADDRLIQQIIGNNSDTRINLELDGNVGSAQGGLVTSGVETFVVTDLDGPARELWTSTDSQDVKTLGLQGNYNDTITFGNTERGVEFLMEVAHDKFDGYSVGTLNGVFARGGADAVVNVVGIDDLPVGEVQKVAGINLTKTASATISVQGGNTVIESIVRSDFEAVDFIADGDLTVEGDLPVSATSIDASGVQGVFTGMIDGAQRIDGDDLFIDGPVSFLGGDGADQLILEDLAVETAIGNTEGPFAHSIDGGTGGVTLTIQEQVDLSLSTLANIDGVVMGEHPTNGNPAVLTLTIEQALDDIGSGNITVADGVQEPHLNITELSDQRFDATEFTSDLNINQVSIAGESEVTLHEDTDLSGVDELLVAEGTTLNLTAAQFQQLDGKGTIVGDGSVNITDLTQADVDDGFDLSGIDVDGDVTVILAEDVTLAEDDDLGDASVFIPMGLMLSLATHAQAHELVVDGEEGSTLKLLFSALDVDVADHVDAGGYAMENLRFQDWLVTALDTTNNIDELFQNLDESVNKVIYNAFVELIDQTVYVEAGTTVRGDITFDRLEEGLELETLTLNLQGGTWLNGDVDLSISDDKDEALVQTYLKSVIINSTGDEPNAQTGNTANVIDSAITTDNGSNQLLDVSIDAEQALVIEGGIVFESIINDDATATLTVTGSADVTLGVLDTSDEDVDALEVVHNGTGVLTVGLDASKLQADDSLSFTGSGSVVLQVKGSVDLSDDTLDAVTAIEIDSGATVTLTADQVVALGPENLRDEGTLEIIELGSQPLDTSLADADLTLDVTTAAGEHTLDAATDLSGVDSFTVGEGSSITMTAEQALQLEGATFGADADSELHITGVTQADLDAGLGDLLITWTIEIGSVTLAENVLLKGSELNTATLPDGFQLIGENVRVDVDMDVATVGNNAIEGVNSDGVSQFVVVDTTAEDAGKAVTDYTFFVCNDTVGLETLGLQLNAGNTINFEGIKRGVDFLLEGDGVANWDELEKELEETDVAQIGAIVAEFFTENNPSAVVNVNNQGVTLGEASDGGVRVMTVDGVTINNTRAVTINVADGDATIGTFAGNHAESLTVTNADGDVATWIQSEGELTEIDASGVSGSFTLGIGEQQAADPDEVDGTYSFDPADFTAATVDLSDVALIDVDAIALAQASELTLDIGQYLDETVVDVSGTNAAGELTVVNLNDEVFTTAGLDGGITVAKVVIAELPAVTLDPATDLTGVGEVEVLDGTTLTLSGDQFVQLVTSGGDFSGAGDIAVEGLTQANVDDLEAWAAAQSPADPFNFDAAFTGTGDVSITLAEEVAVSDDTILGTTIQYELDGNQLTLTTVSQPDGLKVNGGSLKLDFVAIDVSMEMSDYTNITEIEVYDLLLEATGNSNIENVFLNLASSVQETENVISVVAAPDGFLFDGDRVVTIQKGVSVDETDVQFITPDDSELDNVQNLWLNLSGGSTLDGSVLLGRNDTLDDEPGDSGYFQTLTITSRGTAPNTIGSDSDDVSISAGGGNTAPGVAATVENNLLNVVINAEADLVIEGAIVFQSVENVGGDTATLTLTGDADVEIKNLDTTDDDIDNLVIDTTDYTGTLTITGGSDSLELAGTDSLTFVGSGDVLLDTNDGTDGIDGGAVYTSGSEEAGLKSIDASEHTGDLTLGKVKAIDTDAFTFEAGTGQTSMTLIASELDADEDASWSFDFSSAGVGSVFEIGDGTAPSAPSNTWGNEASLSINQGANTELLISDSTDWTGLNLEILGNSADNPIVLGAGVELTLTAEQASELYIEAAPGLEPGEMPTVNISDLENGFTYDFSNIAEDVAGNITLAGGDDAIVKLESGTDLGDFAVVLDENQVIGVAEPEQADGQEVNVTGSGEPGIAWLFNQINAALDASGYSGDIERLFINDQLVVTDPEVEQFWTGLDADIEIINIQFTGDLEEDLENVEDIQRTFEVQGFAQLTNGLELLEGEDLRFYENLTLKLGGDVDIDSLTLDNFIDVAQAADPENAVFQTLRIESGSFDVNEEFNQVTNVFAPEDWDPNANLVEPTANSIGDISGGSSLDLTRVELATDELQGGGELPLTVQTITYSGDDTVVAGATVDTAELVLEGSQDITVKAVDAGGLDFDLDLSGFTGTADINGGSPAIFNTGANITISGDEEDATLNLGVDSDLSADRLANPGIVSETLESLNASGFEGELNVHLSEVSQDFTFTSGDGVNTVILKGDDLALETDGEWEFDFEDAAAGSRLVLTDEVAFNGRSLTIELGAHTVLVRSDADLTNLDELDITAVGVEIVVEAGATLTLTAEQADGLTIVGEGEVNVTELGTEEVDLSGIQNTGGGTITLVDEPQVTLDPATELTGALTLDIGDTDLELTAEQMMVDAPDPDDAGSTIEVGMTIEGASGTVDVTGYEDDTDPLDLSNVSAALAGTLTLSGNVTADASTDFGDFEINIGEWDLEATAAQLDGVVVNNDDGDVTVTALEATPTADLSNILTAEGNKGSVTAKLESDEDDAITLIGANLGIATVEIDGNGTVNVDGEMLDYVRDPAEPDEIDSASFDVGTDATLELTADQADGREVTGDGTLEIGDLGQGPADIDLSGITVDNASAAVDTDTTLDSDADLGTGIDFTVAAGATFALNSRQADDQAIEGEGRTLIETVGEQVKEVSITEAELNAGTQSITVSYTLNGEAGSVTINNNVTNFTDENAIVGAFVAAFGSDSETGEEGIFAENAGNGELRLTADAELDFDVSVSVASGDNELAAAISDSYLVSEDDLGEVATAEKELTFDQDVRFNGTLGGDEEQALTLTGTGQVQFDITGGTLADVEQVTVGDDVELRLNATDADELSAVGDGTVRVADVNGPLDLSDIALDTVLEMDGDQDFFITEDGQFNTTVQVTVEGGQLDISGLSDSGDNTPANLPGSFVVAEDGAIRMTQEQGNTLEVEGDGNVVIELSEFSPTVDVDNNADFSAITADTELELQEGVIFGGSLGAANVTVSGEFTLVLHETATIDAVETFTVEDNATLQTTIEAQINGQNVEGAGTLIADDVAADTNLRGLDIENAEINFADGVETFAALGIEQINGRDYTFAGEDLERVEIDGLENLASGDDVLIDDDKLVLELEDVRIPDDAVLSLGDINSADDARLTAVDFGEPGAELEVGTVTFDRAEDVTDNAALTVDGDQTVTIERLDLSDASLTNDGDTVVFDITQTGTGGLNVTDEILIDGAAAGTDSVINTDLDEDASVKAVNYGANIATSSIVNTGADVLDITGGSAALTGENLETLTLDGEINVGTQDDIDVLAWSWGIEAPSLETLNVDDTDGNLVVLEDISGDSFTYTNDGGGEDQLVLLGVELNAGGSWTFAGSNGDRELIITEEADFSNGGTVSVTDGTVRIVGEVDLSELDAFTGGADVELVVEADSVLTATGEILDEFGGGITSEENAQVRQLDESISAREGIDHYLLNPEQVGDDITFSVSDQEPDLTRESTAGEVTVTMGGIAPAEPDVTWSGFLATDVLFIQSSNPEWDLRNINDGEDLGGIGILQVSGLVDVEVEMTTAQHAELTEVIGGEDLTIEFTDAADGVTGIDGVAEYVLFEDAANDFTVGATDQVVEAGDEGDTLRANLGADTFELGAGDDTVVYTDAEQSGTITELEDTDVETEEGTDEQSQRTLIDFADDGSDFETEDDVIVITVTRNSEEVEITFTVDDGDTAVENFVNLITEVNNELDTTVGGVDFSDISVTAQDETDFNFRLEGDAGADFAFDVEATADGDDLTVTEVRPATDAIGGSITLSITGDEAEMVNGINLAVDEDDGEGFQRLTDYDIDFEAIETVAELYDALVDDDNWDGDSPFDDSIAFADAYDEDTGELTLTLVEAGHSIDLASGYDSAFVTVDWDEIHGFDSGDELDFTAFEFEDSDFVETALDVDAFESLYEATVFAKGELGDGEFGFFEFEIDGTTNTYVFANLNEEDEVTSDDLLIELVGYDDGLSFEDGFLSVA